MERRREGVTYLRKESREEEDGESTFIESIKI
jgi:hypothetical protein